LLSQTDSALYRCEDSLVSLYNSVLEEDPYKREKRSLSFYEEFFNVINKEGSFSFPFDKLNYIGKICSRNKKIRIYTWNIPVAADDNLYFGILQYYSKTYNKYLAVKLNEPLAPNVNSRINNWQGALYYEIVDTRHAGQTYYTLLGFDLHNALSNKKRIDVISIDDYDSVYFCEKLILYNGKPVDYIEFEYNEKATMSLRYNHDVNMIVFDHLSPQKPSLKDNYEFYGPDFTYDGLKFEKGIWVHYKDIDITN
jgi:hypothetical protein